MYEREEWYLVAVITPLMTRRRIGRRRFGVFAPGAAQIRVETRHGAVQFVDSLASCRHCQIPCKLPKKSKKTLNLIIIITRQFK